MTPRAQRRLIINADDFGLSHSVNEAVVRAHREGVLTSASLMVNAPGFEDAVEQSRTCPGLGVGLHLTLVRGRSALAPGQIPGLVDGEGRFKAGPVAAGWRFFFRRDLREQLRAEIRAQLMKFAATGLTLDHVNGHLHLHLHPVVLRLTLEAAPEFRIRHLRLSRDRFWLNRRLAAGRGAYRSSHAVIFGALSGWARPQVARAGIRFTDAVFGLLQDARVDEHYICSLLPRLPAGDYELYSHPSLDEFRHEFEALLSPRVRERLGELGFQRLRYQDL